MEQVQQQPIMQNTGQQQVVQPQQQNNVQQTASQGASPDDMNGGGNLQNAQGQQQPEQSMGEGGEVKEDNRLILNWGLVFTFFR